MSSEGGFLRRLIRRCGSEASAEAAIQRMASGQVLDSSQIEVLAASALVGMGASVEEVSTGLGWRDFELFCGSMIRAWGYDVRENVTLTKPRVQIDIIASSPSVAIVVDCKHWSRGMSANALAKVVEAQKSRARLARAKVKGLAPIVVAIFVLWNEQVRFLDGAAVVPVHTLADFLSNLTPYSESLSYL